MLKILCYVICLCAWRCVICVDACPPKAKPVLSDDAQPMKLYYSEPGQLDVELKLRNISPKVKSYKIYAQKDNEDSDRKDIHHGRRVPKDDETVEFFIINFLVTLNETTSRTIFEVSLEANGVPCNRNLNRKFLQIIQLKKPVKCEHVEKAFKIELDFKNECYNTDPSSPAPGTVTSKDSEGTTPPVVAPRSFKDSGLPFIVFKCGARCLSGEVLVWYQQKQQTKLPDLKILLINQTYNEYLRSGSTYTEATLNKTLEGADRRSVIFCGRRKVFYNGLEFLSIQDGDAKIVLDFDRDIETKTPEITVEPVGDVYFEPNSTMEFVCSSPFVGGSVLTWYEEDPNSRQKRKLESKEPFGKTTMTSTLELYVNETYVSKSIIIYCVQEHYIVYWDNGTKHYLRYGEIAKSNPITLKRKEASEVVDTRSRKLLIGGACVIVAVLVLLAGLLVSRCWRRQTPEEEDYVVPQVTYAVLALPETDSKPPTKPDKQNYVEIVGVYKNKSKFK